MDVCNHFIKITFRKLTKHILTSYEIRDWYSEKRSIFVTNWNQSVKYKKSC